MRHDIRVIEIIQNLLSVFIICHSIRWIPNVYEISQGVLTEVGSVTSFDEDQVHFQASLVWPDWVSSVTQMSHFLTVLNCSVNFYIYFIKYKQRINNNPALINIELENLTVATTLL